MRAILAIVMATLTLGLSHGPALAQTDTGWLSSIHMFDALTGWAVETEGDSGVVAKGAVESVVRTTDGGVHWKDVTPHAPPGQDIGGPGYGYETFWLTSSIAWVKAGTLLFRTIDGGRTWTHATIPAYGSIYFVDARNGWLMSGRIVLTNGRSCPCGQEEDIYRSVDGGKTWTKVASTRADDERSGLPFAGSKEDINFLNSTTGWITGTHAPGDASNLAYLYVTHDGGHTWRLQDLPPLPLAVPFHAYSPMIQIFTARDGILSREYVVPNTVHPVAWGVVFYVTHDGGTTWTPTTPPFATALTTSSDISQGYQGSSFADVNRGWVMNYEGTLYVTSDSGRHWTTIRPGPPFTSSPVA
jgi:photosystem II stability/assembly factor-like uncharacterized protein